MGTRPGQTQADGTAREEGEKREEGIFLTAAAEVRKSPPWRPEEDEVCSDLKQLQQSHVITEFEFVILLKLINIACSKIKLAAHADLPTFLCLAVREAGGVTLPAE